MPISLSADFEAAVAQLAGIAAGSYDIGSLTIDLVNPVSTAPTTARFTLPYQINTGALNTLIQHYTSTPTTEASSGPSDA